MEIFQFLSYWTSVEHSIILDTFSLWLLTPCSLTPDPPPTSSPFFTSYSWSLVNVPMSQHSILSPLFKLVNVSLCVIVAIFTLSNSTSAQFQTCVSNLSHKHPPRALSSSPLYSPSQSGGSPFTTSPKLKPWQLSLFPLLHIPINHHHVLSVLPSKNVYTTFLLLRPHCSSLSSHPPSSSAMAS